VRRSVYFDPQLQEIMAVTAGPKLLSFHNPMAVYVGSRDYQIVFCGVSNIEQRDQ